jgi:DNA invertase Pin-like site-specific DNA recombinase
MKAMFADFERDKISERTKSGLEKIKNELREKGSVTSNKGKRITKLGIHDEMDKARASASTAVKTIADNFAQKIGPTIKELKLGGLNYRLVAMHLNKLEVPTARGGKWHASSVRNVLWRYNDSNVTKRLENK